VLSINQDTTPVGPQMVFDEADRLNFRVGDPATGGMPDPGFALMVCDLTGDCWRSTAAIRIRSNSCCRTGSEPRRLGQPSAPRRVLKGESAGRGSSGLIGR
jgi:hypothetical protein